ncbi:uncharacterized protein LOC128376912 [Scomber japonicus]|uniref:uncharacterized protein LOC128376912 n=1 Tax=Scomber japonicus TaxID=13676 RepID=UPI0023066A66|nr:uncharacterized protein LOC128376912 [Scomber japonicus]
MWKLRRLRRQRRILLLLAELEHPPSPRKYCQVNNTVPVLALYFDGHSDMRPDYRLSRASFSALMDVLGRESDHGWGPEIDTLIFLFWLATPSAYRVVARAFDIPRATIHRVVHRASGKIATLLYRVVRHPTAEELPRLGGRFARLARSAAFNRVVGAIDGCHVRVKPPAQDAACYFNRKLFHSIQLQAMCDDVGKFLDVFVGYCGSVHDARVLRNSPIYYQQSYPPPGYSILGDGGYPCLSHPISLITPFRQPVRSHLQARFNNSLSRARCIVERSFGMLKTRWRSIFFKALEVDVTYVPEVIVCCTVLHNICMSNGDLLEPDADVRGPRRPAPAPPGAVSGADERQRIAMACYIPDHDYI